MSNFRKIQLSLSLNIRYLTYIFWFSLEPFETSWNGARRNGSSALKGLWALPSSTDLVKDISCLHEYLQSHIPIPEQKLSNTVGVVMLNPKPFSPHHGPLLARKQNRGFFVQGCKWNLVSSKLSGNWIWLFYYHQIPDLLGLSTLSKMFSLQKMNRRNG